MDAGAQSSGKHLAELETYQVSIYGSYGISSTYYRAVADPGGFDRTPLSD